MPKPKEDHRDIFQKALDDENTYPAMGAIYGAAIGGLLGELAYKSLRKKHTPKIHQTSPGAVIGISLGSAGGIIAGQKSLENKTSATGRRK